MKTYIDHEGHILNDRNHLYQIAEYLENFYGIQLAVEDCRNCNTVYLYYLYEKDRAFSEENGTFCPTCSEFNKF